MQLSLLIATVSLLAVLPSAAAQSGCGRGVQPRKEVRDLSAAEWQRYVAALRKVHGGRSPTPYDRLSKMHFDNNSNIHNVALFFPWHRQFLRELEILLQQQDASVMLPYWVWSFDSQAPEASPIFSDAYYGGNGRGTGSCVQSGQFRSFQPSYPRQHCLTRQFNLGDRIGAFYSVEHINRLVSTSTTYDALRQGVEFAPHAAVHVNIGSDMSTMYSPNDPIFYAHHAYIDKIWSDWQAIDNRRLSDYGGRNAGGSTARLADRMAPWNYRVQDVMDTRRLCYVYQAFSRTAALPSPSPAPAPSTPTRPAPTPAPAPAPARPPAPAPAPARPQQPAPAWPQQPARPPPTSNPWGSNPWGSNPWGSNPWDSDPWGDDDSDDWEDWGRLVRRQEDSDDFGDDSGEVENPEHLDDEDNWGRLVKRQTDDSEDFDDATGDVENPENLDDEDNWGRLVRRQTPPTPTPTPTGPNAPDVIPAGDRTVLTGVRVPDPIPQAWCDMNKIPVQEMRHQESGMKQICQEVNKIPGYVSPAALWVRDELTERLITPTKQFVYFENGRPVTVAPQPGYRTPGDGVRGLKDHVRRRHGGPIRSDPRQYWDRLQRIVGPVVYPILRNNGPTRQNYD